MGLSSTISLSATHASIPSPVKTPSSPVAAVVAAKEMKIATPPPPQRIHNAKRIAIAIARDAAKTSKRIIEEMSEKIEREKRIRGELRRRGEAVRERMGRLCVALGKTASTDDGSSICSNDSSTPTLENNKALESLNAKILKSKRELLSLRDGVALRMKECIALQQDMGTSEQFRRRIAPLQESVQNAETKLRRITKEIRTLREERISLIGKEFQRRVASAKSKFEHVIENTMFHGIHNNIVSLQRGVKRDLDIAFSSVARNLEKKQQGLAVSKAEKSVLNFEFSSEQLLKQMRDKMLLRSQNLVSRFQSMSKDIITSSDIVPGVISDVQSELQSMLQNLCSKDKTTSLQSLKTSQDEVEMGLKRMKDELSRWQRKKDLSILRQWLRWWHFRARAVSIGVKKTSEQKHFVERFRNSALANGVMEGMMSEMKIDCRRRKRVDKKEENDVRISLVQEDKNEVRLLQDEECKSAVSKKETLPLIDVMTIAVNCFLEESRLRSFTQWTSSFANLLCHFAAIPEFSNFRSALNAYRLPPVPSSFNEYDRHTVTLKDVLRTYVCRALHCEEDDSTVQKIEKRLERFHFEDLDAIRETFEFETITLWRDVFDILIARKMLASDHDVSVCLLDATDSFENFITRAVRSFLSGLKSYENCTFNDLALYISRRDAARHFVASEKEKKILIDDVSETRGLKRSAIQDLSSSMLKRFKENEEEEDSDEEEDLKEEEEIKSLLRSELKDMDYFENHLEDALNVGSTSSASLENAELLDNILTRSRRENEKYECALERYLIA